MSGRLPEGWTDVALADVTRRVANVDPSVEPDREFGYVDISAIDNLSFRITGPKRFPGRDAPSRARRPIRTDDVLFSNVRTYLRNIALVVSGLSADLCSTGFTVLRSNGAVDPRYVFRYVLTDAFINAVTPEQTGTHYPATSDRVVLSQAIKLPPLAEQRRIVARIEALLADVSSSREHVAKVGAILKRFRQSVLAAACSGRLTAGWREQNPDVKPTSALIEKLRRGEGETKVRRGVPERVAESDVVADWDLPEYWGCYSAAELLRCGAFKDMKDGNHGGNHPKASEFTKHGVPFITAAQVNDFRISYEDAHRLSGRPLERIRVGFAKPGDVIYTHKGSVGRVAIADRECVLTPQTTYYRVSTEVFAGRFLMYYLASRAFSEQVDVVKEQTTRDFVPISEQYLLFHRVPPLTEQQEIVCHVDALFAIADTIEKQIAAATARADRLTPSILAKAFRGELVPTEAKLARQEGRDYEPASVLLERMRAEGNGQNRDSAKRLVQRAGTTRGEGQRARKGTRRSRGHHSV